MAACSLTRDEHAAAGRDVAIGGGGRDEQVGAGGDEVERDEVCTDEGGNDLGGPQGKAC